MYKRQRIGLIAGLLVAVLTLVGVLRNFEFAALRAGVAQCRTLAEACRAYVGKPEADGKYPTNLSDLLAPRGVALRCSTPLRTH